VRARRIRSIPSAVLGPTEFNALSEIWVKVSPEPKADQVIRELQSWKDLEVRFQATRVFK
jgi:hypothetical protein